MAQRRAAGEDGVDWARIGGNIVSPANLAAGYAAGGLSAVPVTQAALTGAAQGLLQPTAPTEDSSFTEDKLSQAAVGGAFGTLGAGLAKTAGKVLNPLITKAEQTMKDLGVKLTPGMVAGGQFKDIESIAAGIPLVGKYIADAKERALFSFNKGLLNRTLGKVDEKLPEDVIGRDAIAHTADVIGKKYDEVLGKISYKLDYPSYAGILKAVKTPVAGADRVKAQEEINSIIFDRLPKDTKIDGQTYKQIESMLRERSNSYMRGDPGQQDVGKALKEAANAMKEGLKKQNPDHTSTLRRIDSAYGDLSTMEKAAAAIGSENGVFTPQAYKLAVKQKDISKDKRAFGRGRARNQQEAEAAVGVMVPSKEAGLEGRLALSNIGAYSIASNPAVAGAASLIVPAVAALYSESGVNAMNALMRSRPEIARQLGATLTKRASKEGSITAAQVIEEYNRMTKPEPVRIELRGMAVND
jgi:hypothetical protein